MIQNFTESNLIRFRRSVETKKSSKSACPSGRICIREITSNEFEEVVLNPSQDVMVSNFPLADDHLIITTVGFVTFRFLPGSLS